MENEILKNAWLYYYYLAWFATICFVIKLIIFSIFGADNGGDVAPDFNADTASDGTFGFLSLQSLLAFLMGFGWMGYAALQQFKLDQLGSFLSAFGVGLLFMLGTAYLMFSVKKLEKNVVKDKKTAIGKIGKAYTAFEPKGSGQIEIEIDGQFTVTDAVNNTDEKINAFEMVKVVKVENDMLYIEK